MAKRRKRRIPVYIDTETGTMYRQAKKGFWYKPKDPSKRKTWMEKGQMYGRKDVEGKGDGTKVFRADGKEHEIVKTIGANIRKEKPTGLIFGRIGRGLARASKSTRIRVARMGGRYRRRGW